MATSTLVEFVGLAQDARLKESAGGLIKTVRALKIQYVALVSEIGVLKAKVKGDVKVDLWNGADIELLGQKLQLQQGIKNNAVKYKSELAKMKLALSNSAHKTELQTEINNLNIPS